MKTKNTFLTTKIWQEIGAAAKAGIGHAAVAYVGKDAPNLLPLRKGSVLVCDASLESVQNGLTNPYALGEFIKKGVKVYSIERLHAKVIAFSDVVFVGSMNVSTRSAVVLQEAAIQSRDPATITAATSWIRSNLGEPIGPGYAAELCKAYNSPTWEKSSKEMRSEDKTGNDLLWIVRLDGDAAPQAEDLHEETKTRAQRMVDKEGGFELDWFEWSSKIPDALLKTGGHIVQLIKQGKTWAVHEPERFLRVESKKLKKRYQVVHAEYHSDFGSISLKKLQKRSQKLAKYFEVIDSKLVRGNGIVSELRNLIRNG